MKRAIVWRWRYLLPQVAWLFEPRDLWVGVYWNVTESVESPYRRLDIYICVLPVLPLRLRFELFWDYRYERDTN